MLRPTGARILVVDDEPASLRAVRINLDRHGFQVETAQTGEQALEHAARHPVDLIILDLGLPDLDGLEVNRQVRVRTNTPIIVLYLRTEPGVGYRLLAD